MSSVSTAFKVHYNQKLGGPIRPTWGGNAPWPLGGIDAPDISKITNMTSSFIVVKTERSTFTTICHAGQPQQPGLAQRLPETDGAKVLPTSDQGGGAFTPQALTR